jgi:hypothetical protein
MKGKHSPLKTLQVPSYQKCCDCGKLKIAIARQSIQLLPRTAQPWQFYCEVCALKQGVKPSPELIEKIPKMEAGRE